MRARRLTCALIVCVTGCAESAARQPDGELARTELVRLRVASTDGQSVLRLEAEPGVRINALLTPVLEFADGSRLSLTNDSLTADSSYFVGTPSVVLPEGRRQSAVLRASACPAAVRVCLSVEVPVRVAATGAE